jgi:hypothetical protein
MSQVNTASNVLIHTIFRRVYPYCSNYVTIKDGISFPNDDSESHIRRDGPLCISKALSPLLKDYMNICKTFSLSFFNELLVWQVR